MFVTNWISTTKIQKISEITNFFRHYFLSRTEVPGDSDGGGSTGENKNPDSDDNTQGAGGSGNTGGTGDTDQGGNTDQGGESSGGNEHITL